VGIFFFKLTLKGPARESRNFSQNLGPCVWGGVYYNSKREAKKLAGENYFPDYQIFPGYKKRRTIVKLKNTHPAQEKNILLW
jgi:hypothetical protein